MTPTLLKKMKNKKYRDLFVSGQIKTGIPFQIRATRDLRGWTQEELGKLAGLPQSAVARLENPDTLHSPNIKTLLKIASAFDVALIVRFAPFSELMHWVESVPYEVKGLSPETLAVKSFEENIESFINISTTITQRSNIKIGLPESTSSPKTYIFPPLGTSCEESHQLP